jgi:hypothetical protein
MRDQQASKWSIIRSIHIERNHLFLWWELGSVVNCIWNSTLDRLWKDLLKLFWYYAVAGSVGLATLRASVVDVVRKGLLEPLWDLLLGLLRNFQKVSL